jgi:hypothetical protein
MKPLHTLLLGKDYEELYTAYEKLWAKFAKLYTSTGGCT